MAHGRDTMPELDSAYRLQAGYNGAWNPTRSIHNGYNENYHNGGYDQARESPYRPSSANFAQGISSSTPFHRPAVTNNAPVDPGYPYIPRADNAYTYSPPPRMGWQQPFLSAANGYGPIGSSLGPVGNGMIGPGAGSGSGNGVVATPGPRSSSTANGAQGSFTADDRRFNNNNNNNNYAVHNAAGAVRHSSDSPTDSVDEVSSPNLSDLSIDSDQRMSPPPPPLSVLDSVHMFSNGNSFVGGLSGVHGVNGVSGVNGINGVNGGNSAAAMAAGRVDTKGRAARRGTTRDEFDGPHQFLPRPAPHYVAMQERELPHLPTNLLVQEQDDVLSQVNDRLSQCAFDFVARYQFPIPLTQDMRPVSRPQDREWTEWVQLLKRLATKRRIPARVLYNRQIKQFVTILENSLEMRHAARHQSRPLKDDRNILQLISAGIQVAKILKDAPAMEALNRLYEDTDQRIQDRSTRSRATALQFTA